MVRIVAFFAIIDCFFKFKGIFHPKIGLKNRIFRGNIAEFLSKGYQMIYFLYNLTL